MSISPIGDLLQLLFVASIAVASALLLLEAFKRRPAVPDASGETGACRPKARRLLLWVVGAAVGSRVALVAFAYLVLALANASGGEEVRTLLAGNGLDTPFPALEAVFSHWDAPHYLDIARIGYTAEILPPPYHEQWRFIVYYPLYPAMVALLKPLFQTEFMAATVLSWICLAGACYWIYRLSLIDGDAREARRAVKFLLVFPAAVFLGAPYTESLFLLLTVLSLYAMRRGRWWAAGIAGFFAALTRNLGVLLVIPFVAELLDQLGALGDPRKLGTRRFWVDFLKAAVWMPLIPAGVGAYLLINRIVYGDPLMYLKILNEHWGQHMQAPWKTLLVTWSSLAGARTADEVLYMWLPQMAGMAAMLIALPFLVRRLRPAYGAYLLVYVVAVLTPSWLLSFNRYAMGAVPLFLGIAALTRTKWVDAALTVIFVAVMLFLAAGFVMWKHVV